MNSMEKAGEYIHEGNEYQIESLKERLYSDFPDQNFTSFYKMDANHPIQKALN